MKEKRIKSMSITASQAKKRGSKTPSQNAKLRKHFSKFMPPIQLLHFDTVLVDIAHRLLLSQTTMPCICAVAASGAYYTYACAKNKSAHTHGI